MPPTANLAQNLLTTAQRFPERTALALGETEMTYANLEQMSARVAGLLAASGIGEGDRVALMLPNVPAFAAAYYGVLRLGAVVVPLNVLLKSREVAFALEDSDASALLVWHAFTEQARPAADAAGVTLVDVAPGSFETVLMEVEPYARIADRAPGATAVILYTSGTTGTPKGAELTHTGIASNVQMFAEMLALRPDDVVLGALPLFHAFGQTCALNAAIHAGAQLLLVARFDPAEVLDLFAAGTVTVFEGVPTMFGALLQAGLERPDAGAPGLRLCVSGGAALPVEVLHGFERRFGGVVLEGYGLSETSPVAAFNHPDRERRAGSIGTPVAGVDIRICGEDGAPVACGDVGELQVRGPNVMSGYWNRPEATAEVLGADGWLRTGDLGRQDEDGFLFIVDRKKDLIIRGGYNVYPRELEEVLYEHPDVLEAAVIGIPDDRLGEEVGAAVALRPGATATADALREHVREQVAAYKYPRHVWLVDALPKGPTGKILKRDITVPAGVT